MVEVGARGVAADCCSSSAVNLTHNEEETTKSLASFIKTSAHCTRASRKSRRKTRSVGTCEELLFTAYCCGSGKTFSVSAEEIVIWDKFYEQWTTELMSGPFMYRAWLQDVGGSEGKESKQQMIFTRKLRPKVINFNFLLAHVKQGELK